MRDLRADWKRWSRAERVLASLPLAAATMILPAALPFLSASP